jgi:DNA-binding transcriptional LysR family regulator
MDSLPDLESIAIFAEVARQQSFTIAAQRLGLSKSQVSKKVGALEDRLGAQLLHRTTRAVRLTETGTAFHARCAAVLAQLVEAERAVAQSQSTPRGRLVLSAPMSFGQRYLAPAIGDFMNRYPALQVDLQLSDRIVDVLEDGYDLAVRIATLADSGLVVRKLAPSPRFLYASPGYLKEHGALESPEQLAQRPCLTYSLQTTGETWHLRNADREVAVRVAGNLRSNNGDVLAEAACRGVGIALLPSFIATPALREGRLVRLLEQWAAPSAYAYAVLPPGRHLSAKVRALVEFLVERFREPSWIIA